jgi:uncharacterized protein YfdQ (DUF2303 family)
MDEVKCEVTEIERLAKASVTPLFKQHEDGTQYAVFNDGRIQPLVLDAPRRKQGELLVGDLDSLMAYVEKHKELGTLMVIVWDAATLVVRCIIDHHEATDAGWRCHAVIAKLKATPEWLAWTKADRTEMGQKQFAEWLEDHLQDVRDPDAATLMEVVTTLEATAGAAFRGSVRLRSGDREFAYKHTTDAKAGQEGTLVIPKALMLEMPVLLGLQPVSINARFKYRLTAEGLMLRYEIERREQLLQATQDHARALLAAKFADVPVLLGA